MFCGIECVRQVIRVWIHLAEFGDRCALVSPADIDMRHHANLALVVIGRFCEHERDTQAGALHEDKKVRVEIHARHDQHPVDLVPKRPLEYPGTCQI